MPIGSSARGIIIRQKTSAHNKKTAPNNAEIGIKYLWSVPTNIRTICGIIKPIKPIIPAEYTENPTIIELIIKYACL